MKRFLSPRGMVIASMVIFGTLGPFVRHIGVSSAELALYRAVMAAGLIGGYLALTGQRLSFASLRGEGLLLAVSGVAMGFNWILLFEAYRYTTVSVATLSYYFAPVIVTLACPILFGERIGPRQWVCFAASALGLVLMTGVGDMAAGSNHLLGIAFGLGAACLYAAVVLLNKRIRGVAGIQRTVVQFVTAAMVLLPYVLLTGGVTLGGMSAAGWGCLLAVGVIHTAVAYCLYFSALKDVPGRQAAILSYVDPLVAVAVSVAVLGEGLTWGQALGGALILGFTLCGELAPRSGPDVTPSEDA